MTDVPRQRQLAALSRRELGYLVLDDLLSLSFPPSTIGRYLRSGLLDHPQPRVYGIAGVPLSFERRIHAAVLSAGRERAAASHRAAAYLHDLGRRWLPQRVEVSLPNGGARARLRDGAVLHRLNNLGSSDIVKCGPTPTTSVTWTVIDLANILTPRGEEQVVSEAIRRGWTTTTQIVTLLARRGRVRGATTLKEIIAHLDPETPKLRSEMERLFRGIVRAHAITGVVANHPVCRDDGGIVGIVDAAIVAAKIAIELDGYRFHATPQEKAWDDARQNALTLLGWLVLRFTWDDLTRRPAAVAAQIKQALALRAPRI